MRRMEKVEAVERPLASGERASYEAPVLVEYGRLSVRFATFTAVDSA